MAAPLWKDHLVFAVAVAQDGQDGQGGSDMWAQLMSFRVKPGKDTAGLREQLQAVEQPDSGLVCIQMAGGLR